MLDIKHEIERIEACIQQRGGSVPNFVRAAGVHPATWRRWRAGSHQPNLQTWAKIEQRLKMFRGRSQDTTGG